MGINKNKILRSLEIRRTFLMAVPFSIKYQEATKVHRFTSQQILNLECDSGNRLIGNPAAG